MTIRNGPWENTESSATKLTRDHTLGGFGVPMRLKRALVKAREPDRQFPANCQRIKLMITENAFVELKSNQLMIASPQKAKLYRVDDIRYASSIKIQVFRLVLRSSSRMGKSSC
jgi:hypothetical protein